MKPTTVIKLVSNVAIGGGVGIIIRSAVETFVDTEELSTLKHIQVKAATLAIASVVSGAAAGNVNAQIDSLATVFETAKARIKENKEVVVSESE